MEQSDHGRSLPQAEGGLRSAKGNYGRRRSKRPAVTSPPSPNVQAARPPASRGGGELTLRFALPSTLAFPSAAEAVISTMWGRLLSEIGQNGDYRIGKARESGPTCAWRGGAHGVSFGASAGPARCLAGVSGREAVGQTGARERERENATPNWVLGRRLAAPDSGLRSLLARPGFPPCPASLPPGSPCLVPGSERVRYVNARRHQARGCWRRSGAKGELRRGKSRLGTR